MKQNHATGVLKMSPKNFGFVTPSEEGFGGDIYIAGKNLNGAMDGDTVEVLVNRFKNQAYKGAGPEGKIIKVLKMGEKPIVGTVTFFAGEFLLMPDDARCPFSVTLTNVPETLLSGDKAVAVLTQRPGRDRRAEGRLLEVLGGGKTPGVDITAIVAAHGIPREFPEAVLEEALHQPERLTEEEIAEELAKGRQDLRALSVVTIDSEETKDVDDGISIERTENGNYRLGVHIADVSHYVTEGSALDREAYERGTSVYLPDRVIPMLPRRLSNGICSLNEGADRFAFSVIMEVTPEGRVIDSVICKSVIRVKYKITYNQFYALYEEADAGLEKKYAAHRSELDLMKTLAEILRQARHDRGSVDFNFPETKVTLDENGIPTEIKPYRITFANHVIEEFMLLCNETVAERFFWMQVPFLYRVHGEPETEKIQSLALLVRKLGYTLKGSSKPHPRALQALLESVQGSPRERVVQTMTLRSMQKAEYRGVNDGHFALALKYYCHFTSPIRRYPDLLIHRIMKEVLYGSMSPEREAYLTENMADFSKHCSETERRADETERETVELKMAQYMEQFIGEQFEAVVSGITSFGIFAELENTVEGLIRYESLPEYYVFDRDRMCAVGERSGYTFEMGDVLSVIVANVDKQLHKVEFRIAGTRGRGRGKNPRKKRNTGRPGRAKRLP